MPSQNDVAVWRAQEMWMLDDEVVWAVTVISMEYDILWELQVLMDDVELQVLTDISMEDDDQVSENEDEMSVRNDHDSMVVI